MIAFLQNKGNKRIKNFYCQKLEKELLLGVPRYQGLEFPVVLIFHEEKYTYLLYKTNADNPTIQEKKSFLQ